MRHSVRLPGRHLCGGRNNSSFMQTRHEDAPFLLVKLSFLRTLTFEAFHTEYTTYIFGDFKASEITSATKRSRVFNKRLFNIDRSSNFKTFFKYLIVKSKAFAYLFDLLQIPIDEKKLFFDCFLKKYSAIFHTENGKFD